MAIYRIRKNYRYLFPWDARLKILSIKLRFCSSLYLNPIQSALVSFLQNVRGLYLPRFATVRFSTVTARWHPRIMHSRRDRISSKSLHYGQFALIASKCLETQLKAILRHYVFAPRGQKVYHPRRILTYTKEKCLRTKMKIYIKWWNVYFLFVALSLLHIWWNLATIFLSSFV